MSEQPAPAARPTAGSRDTGLVRRVRQAWRSLSREQRFAGFAAIGLFVTLLFPWYSTTGLLLSKSAGKNAAAATASKSAIGAFSWVEAAILLTALAVLYLLFARGERRAFHLPGGDGSVIMAAGIWAGALIVWRLFDKPELGQGVAVGLRWGIFVALVAAGVLAYAGNRMRLAHVPEPPLPGGHEPDAGAVRISDERPHLAETQVIGDRAPTEALPDRAPTEALPKRPPPDRLPPG